MSRARDNNRPIPLNRWLARQKRLVWLGGGAVALVIVTLLVVRTAQRIQRRPDWLRGPLRLSAVQRASRLSVTLSPAGRPSAAIRVRLLGVEVPEQTDKQARKLIRNVAHPGPVRVSLPGSVATDESRPRVFLYGPTGRMVNELLLRRGLARVSERAHRLASWFKRLEGRARGEKKQMWAAPRNGPRP